MTLYRAFRKILAGEEVINIGDFVSSTRFSENDLKRLVRVGALGDLSAPPLSVLPEFADVYERLLEVGITYADQLLEKPVEEVATLLNVPKEEVVVWRSMVRRWLVVFDVPHG